MGVQTITTVLTPAADYTLTSLAAVKARLNIPSGVSYVTSEDTSSGQVLTFLGTAGIQAQSATDGSPTTVAGPNIQPGCVVAGVIGTTVTLSLPLTGDVPARSVITFGNDQLLDAFLTDAIAQASWSIQNFCKRVFAVETIQDQIFPQRDEYPGQVPGGVWMLRLSQWPIVSVVSVGVQTAPGSYTLLSEGTDFLVKPKTGQLMRLNRFTGYPMDWEAIPTTVIYEGGYDTLPGDLTDACIRMVTKAYWSRGRDPSIMQTEQGNMAGTVRYWVDDNKGGNLPPDVKELLTNSYRVPTVG